MARLIRKTHYERFEEQRERVAPVVNQALAENPTVEGLMFAVFNRYHSPRGPLAVDPLVPGATLEAAIRREIGRLGDDPSFKEVTDRLQGSLLHAAISRAFPGKQSEVSTAYMQQWQMWKFEKSGQKVYEVSPGLASRASKTELRGVTTDLLLAPSTMPYRSIYLLVPPEAGLEVENIDSGTHPVEGIYVTTDRMPDGTPGWRLMVVGVPKRNVFDDALFHFIIPLPPGLSLDEAIAREVGRAGSHGRDYFNAAELKCLEVMPALFRWAMNVVLYATSADARRTDVWNHDNAERLLENAKKHPKGPKRERAKEQLRAANLRRRVYLGAGIPVLADEGPASPGQGAHAKASLIVRTLVQGHWRNQAHGPAHALRKLIWISPFWRGPDDGEVSNPVHKVG